MRWKFFGSTCRTLLFDLLIVCLINNKWSFIYCFIRICQTFRKVFWMSSNVGKINVPNPFLFTGPNQFRKKTKKNMFLQFYLLNIYSLQAISGHVVHAFIPIWRITSKFRELISSADYCLLLNINYITKQELSVRQHARLL